MSAKVTVLSLLVEELNSGRVKVVDLTQPLGVDTPVIDLPPQFASSPGFTMETISAYDAMYYIGNVMRVYGEVSEVYYSSRDDMWYLYIGAPYPYHDFTVMIAGKDYRRYRFPHLERLEGAHIWSMGLITEFDGKPEILIRKPYQLGVY